MRSNESLKDSPAGREGEWAGQEMPSPEELIVRDR